MHSDHVTTTWMRAEWNFHWIWITIEKRLWNGSLDYDDDEEEEEYSHVPLLHGLILHDIPYSIMTVAEHKSEIKLTTDTHTLPSWVSMGCLLWGIGRKLTVSWGEISWESFLYDWPLVRAIRQSRGCSCDVQRDAELWSLLVYMMTWWLVSAMPLPKLMMIQFWIRLE